MPSNRYRHKSRGKSNTLRMLGESTLAYGKYTGKPLGTIPRKYLSWYARTVKNDKAGVWFAKQYLNLTVAKGGH